MFGVAICTLVAECHAQSGPPAFEGAYTVTPVRFNAAPTTPLSSAVGDLDEDGHPDLVLWLPSGFEIYRGDANGSFDVTRTSHHMPAWLGFGVPFAFADITGDGHLDVCAADFFLGVGAGDGTFSHSQPITNNGPGFGSITLADLNGDGRQEAVIPSASWEFRIFPGQSSGGFDSVRTVLGPEPASQVHCAIGDVDGDGLPDLAWAGRHPWNVRFGVLRNLGGFAFAEMVTQNGRAGPIHVGDFSGDGHADLVVGRDVLLGNGAGAFTFSSTTAFEVQGTADLDQDGRLDLYGWTNGAILWCRVGTDGVAGVAQRLPSARDIRAVHAMDLAGDGWPDLVAVSGAGYSIVVHANRPGTGLLSLPRHATGRQPVDLVALDANGDGAPDLVAANRGERRLATLINDGTSFVPGATLETPAGLAMTEVADLDGDGAPEIVAMCDTAGTVAIATIAAGSFIAHAGIAVAGTPQHLATGDLDDDGLLEIVVTARAPDSVFVIHDPMGTPQVTGYFISASYPRLGPTVVADGNGDGHQDVIVGTHDDAWHALNDYPALVVPGDGQGALGAPHWPPLWMDHRPVAWARPSGSGLPALVLVAARDSAGHAKTVLQVWNRGAGGTLEPRPRPGNSELKATSTTPSDLAAADLEGDGVLDMLACDPGVGAVFVTRTSDPAYGPGLGAGAGASAMALADFDADGALDLAVACADQDDIAVLRGTAAGTPTPVLVSLVDASREAGVARVRWSVRGDASRLVHIERFRNAGPWTEVGATLPGGDDLVEWNDAAIAVTERVGYRLRLDHEETSWFGEVWLEAAPVMPWLRVPGYHSSRAEIELTYSMGAEVAGTLELFDLHGRRLESRTLAPAVGEQRIALGQQGLRPGLYLIRLRAGAHTATARAMLVR